MMSQVITRRPGERPRVSTEGPQTQLSQQAPPELWGRLVHRVFALPGVMEGHSAVSPASSRAVFLKDVSQARVPEVSLAPEARWEPVHLHGVHDTSLHLVLPPERGAELTALGWAEPHQYEDFGTEFLIYGPRDAEELEVVLSIVIESLKWARGPGALGSPQ
ncbi:luciferase family protein [Psychromicrobium xiongbiense]|uniref:luciferase domain-containing protein n=1 Tax=Psychromicrobium xiongbiense TaxID=3051184 RepID=UPI0025569EF9|nr:luciferase family protein [Psychromicrobium sp. YIM S02556]